MITIFLPLFWQCPNVDIPKFVSRGAFGCQVDRALRDTARNRLSDVDHRAVGLELSRRKRNSSKAEGCLLCRGIPNCRPVNLLHCNPTTSGRTAFSRRTAFRLSDSPLSGLRHFPPMQYSAPQHLDTFVLEYALQPRFWLLGISLISWWLAVVVSLGRQHTRQLRKGHEDLGGTSRSPKLALHLVHHVTTPLRKAALVLLNVVILSGYLLDGYWVGVTLARWTDKLIQASPNYARAGPTAYVVFICSVIFMTAICISVGLFWVILTGFQVVCVCEIFCMVPVGRY